MDNENVNIPSASPEKAGVKKPCKALYFIKPIVFLIIFSMLLVLTSYMLAPKDNTKGSGINNPNAHGFYSEPKNSIQVAVIGNSDAYSGFSPMELWKNFGYTSYVSGEGRQLVASSLIMLNKLLTCQKPEIVIFEVDGVFTDTDVRDKAVSLFNTVTGGHLSVFQYHDRWKKARLSELFSKPVYTAHCVTKGQKMSNDVKPYTGGEYMLESDERERMPFVSRRALDEIVDTCEKNGIQLILLEVPSETSWNMERHNSIQDYADEKELPFIDLNIDMEETCGVDWLTDTRDKGNHLNTRGARKVTQYIGQYLKDNYDLECRTGDEEYSRWDEDLEIYETKAKI